VLVVASAGLTSAVAHRTWSWPLFGWGALLGPLAAGWAFYSTHALGRTLVKKFPDEKAALTARLQTLWPRYRATYTGTVLMCVGIAVLSAGLHSPVPDAVLTGIWLVAGVLPPLIAYRVALRRLAVQSSDAST